MKKDLKVSTYIRMWFADQVRIKSKWNELDFLSNNVRTLEIIQSNFDVSPLD